MKKSALHVVDSRTGLEYDIPIKHNAVQAVDFKRIKASEQDGVTSPYDNLQNGLRILDSGFQNTAVKESNITFMYVFVVASHCLHADRLEWLIKIITVLL